MAEILTESFCERCGTRYTFQTAAPRRGRLARLRVATKGLRNYVLEDGSSLEDAFGEARNEEERAISGQQLEAFHKTFNFCMSCRQYTCGNCWNPAENRCLTCAPDLSREVMPAPFPELAAHPLVSLGTTDERAALTGLPWPEVDLARPADGHDGALPALEALAQTEPEASEVTATVETVPVARVEESPIGEPVATGEEPALAGAPAEPEPKHEDIAADTEPVSELEVTAAGEPEEPTLTETAQPEAQVAPAVEEPTAAAAAPVEPLPSEPWARAAAAAARTSALLGRFRPGQSLDAALEAYERGEPLPAVEPSAAAEVEPEPATEPVAAEVEPALEPEPVAAEVEPVPEPEPVAPAPRRDDRVEVPVWRIVAPDTQVPGTREGPAPAWPPVGPLPSGAPAWPTGAWATPEPPPTAVRAREAMWAESARDIVDRTTSGVQACVSCGLPLSATARFCRRCGTRQG